MSGHDDDLARLEAKAGKPGSVSVDAAKFVIALKERVAALEKERDEARAVQRGWGRMAASESLRAKRAEAALRGLFLWTAAEDRDKAEKVALELLEQIDRDRKEGV